MEQNELVSNSTEALERLQKKRQALEQAIHFAQNINKISDSLEAVILLSEDPSKPDLKAERLFKSLSDRIKSLPTDEIRLRWNTLNERVQADLQAISTLAAMDEEEYAVRFHGNDGRLDSVSYLMEQLNNFRRIAQTAVAIRLLLKQRGEATETLELPLPKDELKAQLLELQHKEVRYRERIRNEMQDMVQDLDRLLTNPTYPQDLRAAMTKIREQLTNNIAHIESGYSLESMPLVIENVTIEPGTGSFAKPAKARKPNETDTPPPVIAAEAAASLSDETKKPSFLKRLWIWLTSPWSVTWEDTAELPQREPKIK